MSKLPGVGTQSPGGVAHYPGSVAQSPGGVAQLAGGVAQSPGSLVQLPGSVAQLPGGLVQLPGGVAQLPGGLVQLPGGVAGSPEPLTRIMVAAPHQPARESGLQVARLKSEFAHVVRPLMDLVDDLRDIGIEEDISLPAIVVVGDQSTGKSSVLEAISGIPLPRGTGIVTRCPLEMRLRRKEGVSEFHIQPGSISDSVEVVPAAETVEERVRTVQDRLAGREKGISRKVITVTVKASDIPDLTLIDLPGIARVASEGQPQDIERMTKELIKSKISDEGTIILVVIPANVDIATIEALKMAQEVDPRHQRTLGVITKPDLIDRGAEPELLEVLFNKKYYLDHGYTVVKCRNQADVARRLSLTNAMDDETQFFASKLKEVPDAQKGVPNLCKKLSSLLVAHIRSRLPQISNEVETKLRKTQQEGIELGDGPPQDPQHILIFVQRLTSKFLNSAKQLLEGRGDSAENNIHRKSREAFAKYQRDIQKLVPELNDATFLYEVSQTMNNERGRQMPGFIDYAVAEKKIQTIVEKMRDPARDCMQSVSQECHRTLLRVVNTSYKGYDKLTNLMKQVVQKCVEEEKQCCARVLDHLFDIEKVVFSQDDVFMTAMGKVETEKMQLPSKPPQHKSGFSFGPAGTVNGPNFRSPTVSTPVADAAKCRDSIVAYLKICTGRIQDHIPMTIRYHMSTDLYGSLDKHALYLASHQEALTSLTENEVVASRRQYLLRQMERLSQAQAKLQPYIHAD